MCSVCVGLFDLGSVRDEDNTGELGYDGPLYNGFLHMTVDMLGPSPMHIEYSSTDFAYDGPILLVPLSLSYPSSPVFLCLPSTLTLCVINGAVFRMSCLYQEDLLMKCVGLTCWSNFENIIMEISSMFPIILM